jgi:hypothetical protein
MLNYYELKPSLRMMIYDDIVTPILLSIVKKLSDSCILTSHCKPCSYLWAGYKMAKRTYCQTVLGPENITDMISWTYHNDAGLLWNDTILCMAIGCLQYYSQLTKNCQILGYSQFIAIQAAVCELIMLWPRDSNPRAYFFWLVHIISDS